ncbi:right-handed parallel beta-helix repeat-containing protein [Marilutibacter alkalisoli]|uniref:Right-handed parallel beta-helix repeat-containing protein n=1 Tax=Marilutibacter alkalisoli TaxID=2591633 RepID=A0A514BVK2_9GAMM|nr:right-handed parallel beta-helix repeat-containing protein [Lysobacter alkalisoli]QDH71416.1 right-handed parallel beta-helix repeat-containing protein [Lysobacter alkalisoli]
MIRTLTCLALTCVALSICPSLARAAESYDNCTGFISSLPATISTQGTWCLNKDLSTGVTSGSAITVNTNNVTLDCNHFKLGGLAAGLGTTATGIRADTRQNLTVRNCNIRGFQTGVAAVGNGSGHLVENSKFDKNTHTAIDVRGDGNLVRNNIVIDTGGGTGNPEANGIHGQGNTDIRNNQVDGVIGTGGSNTTVYGIRLTGGHGAAVGQNVVRNTVPTGTGLARGIYTSNGLKIFLDDNRVSLPSPLAGSQGYRCNSSNGALRNSTSWGFATANSGCLDDGGNAVH